MTTAQTKKTMRIAIVAQCTGMIAYLLFNNGFILSYLSKLGIPSARIMIFLSLPMMISFLLGMPFAFLSDRFGKKLFGMIGVIVTIAGFLLLTLAGHFPNKLIFLAAGTGITLFGAGITITTSSWFALLEPIVPPHIRGRFFGNLRLIWHISGIIFTLIVSAVLKANSDLAVYQIILAFVVAVLIVRIFFYIQVPEIDKPGVQDISFKKSFIEIIRIPGYFPFCSYVFLLELFIGACPWIFGVLEKDVLNVRGSQIVLVGNLLSAGSIIGFYYGGRMIDRYGTKFVFLFCHLSFGAILFLFVGRNIFPFPIIGTVGFLTACYGLINAALAIAIVTEMMALVPKENKSLSTSFNNTLLSAGIAISGIISGKIIELNILNKSWELFGQTMSNFDTLLLVSGIMVILLVVTLGLIPSVVGKAQWIPRGS